MWFLYSMSSVSHMNVHIIIIVTLRECLKFSFSIWTLDQQEGQAVFGLFAMDELCKSMNTSLCIVNELEISDELIFIVKNNLTTEKISVEQIKQLKSLLASWIEVMQKEINFINDIKSGKIKYSCPMGMYDFWTARFKSFTTIIDQLTSEAVEKNIKVIEEIIDSNTQKLLNNFNEVKREFKLLYNITVKDTMYYMDKIHKGLYAIAFAPFPIIVEDITPLYKDLNILWLTSNFYHNQNERMESLIESISNLIARRVADNLSVPELFKNSKALSLIKDALKVIDQWKTKFFQCKEDIEILAIRHGKNWSWNFNEDLIFHKLNFCYSIVSDLDKIFETVEKFKFTIPEINYIIKNEKQSEEFRKKIFSLFFKLKTNVYENEDLQNWNAIVYEFFNIFETIVLNYFNQSLNVSKIAFNDYNALRFFENILTQKKQKRQINSKYIIVLERFMNEINKYHTQIESIKSSVQILKVPSVVQHFYIIDNIIIKAKRTMCVIESAKEFPTAEKNKATTTYGTFCEKLITLQKEIITKWCNENERYLVLPDTIITFVENKLVSTFNKELFTVMDVASQLDDQHLPKKYNNLIIKRTQIHLNVKEIDKLVKMFNEIVTIKDHPVILAMNGHINKIKNALRPGLEKRLTCLSVKLPTFVNDCIHLVEIFNLIYNDIKKYETIITKKLEFIESVTIFSIDSTNDIQELSFILAQYEIKRNQTSTTIMKTIQYTSDALDRIERKCYVGKAKCRYEMSLLYEKYENALFDSLINMVLQNLKMLKTLLDGDHPFFTIYGKLENDGFTLIPDIGTITAQLNKAVDNILDELKFIPRWMKGTNKPIPLVQNIYEGADFQYSFYDSVVNNEHTINIRDACYVSITKIGDRLENTIQNFQKFEFLLCKKDCKVVIDKFAAINPTLNDYKEKLSSLSLTSESIKGHPYLDVGCIRLNNTEYNNILLEQCEFWRGAYAKQLLFECEQIMTNFFNNIMTLKEKLNTHFRDIRGLVIVEEAIKEIKKTVFQADLTIHDVKNRFHFLIKHNIIVPKSHLKQFKDLQTYWEMLYKDALGKGFEFDKAKKSLESS